MGRRPPSSTRLLPDGTPLHNRLSSRYGRMRVLRRRSLEAASCECYALESEPSPIQSESYGLQDNEQVLKAAS